jgi:2-oxoacid:acceptor oxidoreductase gamma subunit (pyruvate/2-ketoisovalerate family)
VIATTRFGWEPIRTFSLVETPDVVVVLDETLLRVVDVTSGIRQDGLVLINSTRRADFIHLNTQVNISTTNASGWAREAGLIVAGTVLFNTTILGGFCKATGLISMESMEKALRHHFKGQAGDRNVEGARLAYSETNRLRECGLVCG